MSGEKVDARTAYMRRALIQGVEVKRKKEPAWIDKSNKKQETG